MPIYPYSFTMPPVNKQDIPSDGVVGEFLGISAGGVLDWLPVAGGGGGGDMLKADNLSGLADYAIARTNIGLGTTSTPTFANLTLTSPSLTSDAPVTISQTWNNAAVAFTGLKVNATSTNSASGSLLLDLQVGGVSKFYVNKAGDINTVTGINCVSISGTTGFFGGSIRLNNNAAFLSFGSPASVVLQRDDADNTLALRNGALPQTFNVYGTSSASNANYARLALTCGLDGNATISTQALGTGTAGTVSINGVPVGLGKGNVSSNLAIGTSALAANTTGTNNVALGPNVLLSNTTGTFNFGLAENALRENTTGSFNAALGASALQLNTTGSNNTALGVGAGAYAYNGGTLLNNTNSSSSIFIGRDTRPDNLAQTNQIVIGYQAIGIGSNSVVLGNDSITKTALKGNVGIGTTAPSEKLHVLGGKVLFGDLSDPTGTAGNGELTLHARTLPQLNMVSNVGTNAFFGLSLKAGTAERAGFLVNMQSGEVKIGGGTGGYFPTFYSNNAEIMRLSTTGNVGIGTTSPTSKLHVVGDELITGNVSLSNGSVTVLGTRGFTLTPADGIFQFLNNAQTGFDRIQLGGASTGHPAIKRNGASIDITLASDGITFTSIQDLYRRFGAGSPEGAVIAPIGAVFHRTDGGAGTSFYVKESGTGNTGWVGK